MPLKTLLFLTLAATGLDAQTFEVATIKPNATSDNRAGIRMAPGGRFDATGLPMKALIGMAFNVRDFQVLNAPGWLSADRWDISAKAPDSMGDRVPMDQIRVMLKAVLAERLQLKAHEETREMPVYHLVVAKGGLKMKAAEAGGERNQMMKMGRGIIEGTSMPLAALVQQLSQALGRTVIDKTELTGNFEVKLEWSPEPGQGGGAMGLPVPHDAMPAAGASGPTLFTAVQEQLGLRLESAKGPVAMLVIDSIEKPSEN